MDTSFRAELNRELDEVTAEVSGWGMIIVMAIVIVVMIYHMPTP